MQEDVDGVHKYLSMFCDTNQFPSLPFCASYTKPHGVRRLSKYYHMLFDTQIGHGTCEIRQIPCYFVYWTYLLDKPWVPSLLPQQQLH